ncbi:MAG: flavodoxin family protein [Bacillota bacterium]
MKIGIIVHSQTGHTLLVGERIREKLQSDGHEVRLMRMQNLENEEAKNPTDVQLDSLPETAGFDALIFGAWVQAFTLCPGFLKYLEQIPDIDSENVSCFLTQQFRYKWMGGNRAISKMKTSLKAKGAVINSTGIINWSNKKREQQIEELAALFSRQYQS